MCNDGRQFTNSANNEDKENLVLANSLFNLAARLLRRLRSQTQSGATAITAPLQPPPSVSKRRKRRKASGSRPPTADTPRPAITADTSSADAQTAAPPARRQSSRQPRQAAPTDEPTSSVRRETTLPCMQGWSAPEKQDQGESVRFCDLGLHDRLLRALFDDLKFEACTPVQGKVLPSTLLGRDLTGQAQTGTGKTAAFLITIFQRYLTNKPEATAANAPFALIMAPTRELAIQIHKDAECIGRYCGMNTVAVYGGMHFEQQQKQLAAGVDILVATPGRLLDFCRRRVVDLSTTQVLVIDEADRMLDMGFIPDMRRIIAMLPPPSRRQTLFFSATLPAEITSLADRWTNEPVSVKVEPEQVVAEGVNQIVYSVSSHDKLALLLWILTHQAGDRILIFRNRRRDCESLLRHLQRHGINCALLSGDVSQGQRLRVLEEFRAGKIRVIVATDVAGRGLHVEGIGHVINFDLPYEPDDYVHRVGRTGRAGAVGKAISFACEEGAFVLPDIEKYIQGKLAAIHPEPEMLVMPVGEHIHPIRPTGEPVQRAPRHRRSTAHRQGGGGGGGNRSFRSSR